MLREIKFNDKVIVYEEHDDVDRSIAAEIFKLREYRGADEAISSAGVIVDVGAHIGLFSLYCHALNPKAQIIILEPEPNNFSALQGNLGLNGISKEVICLEKALSTKTGIAHLNIMADSHNHHLGPIASEGKGISVKTISLKALAKENNLKRIDVLKLDIEGAEFEIIEHWNNADFKLLGTIVLEYHEQFGSSKVLSQQLRESGFGVQIFPSKFEKTMGFLLANNKR